MNAKHVLPALVIAFAIPAGHSEAQEVGQAGRGLALAQRLCAQCHVVQKQQTQSSNENAPGFQVIALHCAQSGGAQ